jgi:hypothetical protein
MAVETAALDAVPVSRIFLSLDNPRHIPFDNETKVIEHLCAKEDVYSLARDIHRHGLNPLEKFALIPITSAPKSRGEPNYFVAEGNRRLCALKLLNDPELAPAQLRKSFSALAETWAAIKTIPGVLFKNKDDVNLWLERIHSGPQGGIGRKEWNAEQKTRFHGENKNRATQAILDYAQQQKMLTEAERHGKLTTAQRFISNEFFREILGVDQSDPENIGRTRPGRDFDLILKKFIRDLVAGKDVTSRMNQGCSTLSTERHGEY